MELKLKRNQADALNASCIQVLRIALPALISIFAVTWLDKTEATMAPYFNG